MLKMDQRNNTISKDAFTPTLAGLAALACCVGWLHWLAGLAALAGWLRWLAGWQGWLLWLAGWAGWADCAGWLLGIHLGLGVAILAQAHSTAFIWALLGTDPMGPSNHPTDRGSFNHRSV